jgi:hypothetical protein
MTLTADITVTAERIDQGRFSIETTERIDLINRAQATYQRYWDNWEGTGNPQTNTVRDADSVGIAKYGILYDDSREFPYVITAGQAQDVISWLVSDRAETRYVVRFAGGAWLQKIEIGDVVAFDSTGSAEFAAALLGLVSATDLFRVVGVDRPEDGTVEVVAVQILVPSVLLKEDEDGLTLEDTGAIEL